MIPSKADALLGPVTEIDGFLLACLIDASTGMVLAARQDGFLYLVLDRQKSNLALARHNLKRIETDLTT